MGYDALVDRLHTDERRPRIVALPDGSVDEFYEAFDGQGKPIETREAFGAQIGRSTYDAFPIELDAREPGGQAVNMATQADALGAKTTLFGHLDHPVFADLPFETVSMGEPSRITVLSFAADDLLLARKSPAYDDWSLADLERAAPASDGREALGADAICCGNWTDLDGLTDAIETLSTGPPPAETFVLDPGPVSLRSRAARSELLDALGGLDSNADVVYSVNRTELEATVDAIDGSTPNAPCVEQLAAVRETADITAAILHDVTVAAVATRDGEHTLENLSIDDPRRPTGAGDRFSAAIAVARARGWEWETALALGNACATYAVATASTGDSEELRTFLESSDAT